MTNQIRKIIIEELKEAYLRNSTTSCSYVKPDDPLLDSIKRLLKLYMDPTEYNLWCKNAG